ncbi:protein-glutamate methylesterase/protein-glutamine glutaminase [Denitromonas iodatirespirans]|uniref:Protein-glutamate methylesterase/protein-glutamine glutaminase n=1 Tax=Denitromonas iodatirespirans TaxID=2795389 RepID=A0A944DIL6_DENI1|nr:chemotaxis response regulator protein-glutamate methylesterase [Denitromonas iodatirespirans]MBT0963558.1 chemotaxis response regulator protein-glutamate methylesterase [Denitromonas iodatirespirans]
MSIKVLICDDSAATRLLLRRMIDAQPDMRVVGMAADALAAREMIKTLNPDVLTLDVEMPRMNGLDFLERLMRLRPMPVVMVSAFTGKESEASIKALELGAVEVSGKPDGRNPAVLAAYAEEICDKIRAAREAHVRRLSPPSVGTASAGAPVASVGAAAGRIICIGASTGGTEAIREVLVRLPRQCPPVLIVQHMPEMFTSAFAKRLDSLSQIHVKEAEHGERIMPGCAYLAPGHSHLLLKQRAVAYHCELSGADPVNRHRPSVDVLFHSAAAVAGKSALGVLLTGMGKDGAQGLLAMRRSGAWTIGQDQASCVVYGMPREAAMIGAVSEVAPLNEVALRIMSRLSGSVTGATAQDA